MRVVILAGSGADGVSLGRLLRRRFMELCADVRVQAVGRVEEFPKSGVEFAFFDADMASPGSTRALRREGFKAPIVFFSESVEQALNCYEAHPAGYLIKPFEYAPLRRILDWHRGVFAPAMRCIDVASARASVRVCLADILYIEVRAHKCLIHRQKDVIATNRSLASVEAQLKGEPFLRPHRSILVNMNHIRGADSESIRMVNKEVLPVSAENAPQIKKALLAYQREITT